MLRGARAAGGIVQPLSWLSPFGLCDPLVRYVSSLAVSQPVPSRQILRQSLLPSSSPSHSRFSTATSPDAIPTPVATPSTTATPAPPARVVIVGSGPSAFYTAKYLLKEYPSCTVDMLEALPAPFGLVRYGVAPDHPEVKNVANDFQAVLDDARVRWYGNVRVGEAGGAEGGGGVVGLDELRRCYDAVVCAYGAGSERRLAIPGSELRGIVSARSFVNWYNGHPLHLHEGDRLVLPPPLQQAAAANGGADVVVVGQGNVAVDCARVLLKGSGGMARTDIADHTLRWLGQQPLPAQRVTLLGRRGAVQSAFTIGEFREVSELQGVRVVIDEEEMRQSEADEASQRELESSRPKKRKHALMRTVMDKAAAQSPDIQQLLFRFLLSPLRYLPSPDDSTRVGAVVCQRMKLHSADGAVTAVPLAGQEVTLPAAIVLESIGYVGQPLSTLPFDARRGVLSSERGRVVGTQGVYVCGWLKRGASGIIGSNISDAKETVASVVDDLRAGEVERVRRGGQRERLSVISEARKWRVVDKEGWRRMDEWEKARGAEQGRDRVKLVRVEDMLKIAETQPQMT